MFEIKIDNSNLQLKEVSMAGKFKSGGKFLSSKHPLFYIVKLGDSERFTSAMVTVVIPGYTGIKDTDAVDKVWIIEEIEEVSSVQNYSLEETNFILETIVALSKFQKSHADLVKDCWYKFIQTAEKLVRATKIDSIITGFYKKLGDKELINMQPINEFFKNNNNPKDFKSDSINVNRYLYDDSKTIDVLKVIDILVEEGAYINLSPEHNSTDEYINVTTNTSSFNNNIHINDWVRVVNKVGNSSRSNISLSYLTKIDIDIPENPYVPAGVMVANTIRNVCIIKDGFLWKKTLSVKISSKVKDRLEKKGVTIFDGLDDGSYIIDLTSIPIVSKYRMDNFCNDCLSTNFYNLICVDSIVYFLQNITTVAKVNKPKSEKEIYLASLGIEGDFYNPPLSSKQANPVVIDRTIEEMPSIQFQGDIRVNGKLTKFTHISLGSSAVNDFEDCFRKGFSQKFHEYIFNPVLDRIGKGEKIEDLIKEYSEESSRLRNERMNFKVIISSLTGSVDYPCKNISFTKVIKKDLLSVTVVVKYFKTTYAYTSYKW